MLPLGVLRCLVNLGKALAKVGEGVRDTTILGHHKGWIGSENSIAEPTTPDRSVVICDEFLVWFTRAVISVERRVEIRISE